MIQPANKIQNNYSQTAINAFLLLFPGALSALLLFLIASNRFFPGNKECTIFLLNLFQLQFFGITIVKYGIDQVIISRLEPGKRTDLGSFFSKRVLPLTVLFCIAVGIIKGWEYGAFFLLILPMEVFYILVNIELSVSNRIKFASLLTIVGYPLAFMLTYVAYKQNHLSENIIFICFLVSSVIKLILSFLFRNKGDKTKIAILSYHVPVQQAGNYFMFRFDQFIIAITSATIIIIPFLANKVLVGYYLFLAKFPEVASGVIVSLAPVLYKKLGDETEASLKKLFKDRLFMIICIGILIGQPLVSLLLFRPQGIQNDMLLFVPFLLSSLLILPANLVTYVLLKKAEVPKINVLNLFSCIAGVLTLCAAFFFKNIYIFSWMVPVQLLLYIILFQKLYYKP